jgi:hypothetical protein
MYKLKTNFISQFGRGTLFFTFANGFAKVESIPMRLTHSSHGETMLGTWWMER